MRMDGDIRAIAWRAGGRVKLTRVGVSSHRSGDFTRPRRLPATRHVRCEAQSSSESCVLWPIVSVRGCATRIENQFQPPVAPRIDLGRACKNSQNPDDSSDQYFFVTRPVAAASH